MSKEELPNLPLEGSKSGDDLLETEVPGEDYQRMGEKYLSEEVDEEEQEEEEKFFLEEQEEEEVEEEEEILVYDTNDFISKPYMSPEWPLDEDVLVFDYSYGYNCQKYFNLCVVDKTVLIFGSGNIIHFFDTSTGSKWYRRCFSNGGIGHITKNPKEPHIAIGEKGENPLIIIYEWPSFEIVTILEKGTKTKYNFLNYSPDGELLCSQGDYPDYLLTIWNWRKHKIMLRSKAYGQTVFNSRFSLYVPGHLTTSGINHIKFWKMNQTFTGLKLQGDLGRFGKSEICNIVGFLALPDEKVVSGCEWGNILVWDAGLIRVEVFRRGKNFCHDAPITQFIYNNGDLTTVAMDGTIKVWYYETIELADPPEEDKFIEVEPIFEFEIGDYYHKAKLLVIVESDPDDPDNQVWFGQDGNGGIWELNLSLTVTPKPPNQIFLCHASKVIGIQCSPFSTHLASLGEDGRFFIYDYKQKAMILKKEFLAGGSSLLWLPLAVEESGCVLIGGFLDGVIRVVCVSLVQFLRKIPSPTDDYINLIQVSKPHEKPITVITINPKNTIVVTGSIDCTIFVYQIFKEEQFVKLLPIGFVPVSGEVTHLTWKPRKEATLLVSCSNGTFMELELPQEPPDTDQASYLLEYTPTLKNEFVSIKSQIRRDLKLAEILSERQAILEEKRQELMQKAEATGGTVDETIIEALQEELEAEEPDLPELYIPPVPNPILFATYIDKLIWLSMGGFDAGYMYQYSFNKTGPVEYKMIVDADDVEISTYHYYHNNKYLILAMRNGRIRIVKVNPSDHTDLTKYWELAMHDQDSGSITGICFNYNYSYMFTCGCDGNVFAYKVNLENEYKNVNLTGVESKGFPSNILADIDDKNTLTLEQEKKKRKFEKKMEDSNEYKREVLEVLKEMEKKYDALVRRNGKLPKSQQLQQKDLALDPRIAMDLDKQLEDELNTVRLKLSWLTEKSKIQHDKMENYFLSPVETMSLRVSAINYKEMYVETFRLRKSGPYFEDLKKLVLQKIEEQEAKGGAKAAIFTEEEVVETIMRRPNPVEGLIKQIMVICGDYKSNIKLRRLLRKYRERKDRMETRRIEWLEMMRKKPSPETQDPEDLTSIELAKETIGDYQLKTAPEYKVSKNKKLTTVHVYQELLETQEKIQKIKRNFNDRVLNMRQKKVDMIKRHEYLRGILLDIAKEIPKEKIRNPPNLPTFVEDMEYPEKKFIQTESMILDELPKRFRTIFKEEVVKKKEIKPLDREHEMLIMEKRGQTLGKVYSRLALMKFSGITGSRDLEELEKAGKDNDVITPWEKELKKLRVIQRLYEQDGILDEMETGIKEFDDEIVRLIETKYQTQVDLQLLELHLLTLHQEVLILKKFEAAEEEKENKLFEKLKEKHEIQKKMNELNSKVEGRNREIRKTEEEIKNLVTLFHASTQENKFYNFLKKIFKKKYRPPKIKTDDSDSESESESSSSSEEEDAKSLDSKDMEPIRLDETVCPPGCDPQIYQWTFTQRSLRHTLELNIMEEKKQIDIHKKDYDVLVKKIRQVESQYMACKEDLEEYMREKQRNLNEVETVVVLRLSQIQNFKSESELEKMSESVVFSGSKLTSLYKRVGELDKETSVEKQKHEKNRQHLTRMKIDVNHMKETIVKLKKDIQAAMIRKFGSKIDMDDIEETLLKRLVAEMHGIVLQMSSKLEKNLMSVKNQLKEKENEYSRILQENTDRQNMAAVLLEEKLNIHETLKRQDKIICAEKNEENYDKDVEKLQKIVKMQEKKKAELRKEIGLLKLKEAPKPCLITNTEVIQKILIKSFDGNLEEIDQSIRDELRDMCDEAQEIAEDIKEGDLNQEDVDRMRKLTQNMVEKLPEKCRAGILSRLSKMILCDEATSKRDDGLFMVMWKQLNTESLLEAIEIIKDVIDSVVPHFGPIE